MTQGRVVDFSSILRPAAEVRAGALGPDAAKIAIASQERADREPIIRTGDAGGKMLLSILGMSPTQRAAAAAGASDDPLVVWFALLTNEERRGIVQHAEDALRALPETTDRKGELQWPPAKVRTGKIGSSITSSARSRSPRPSTSSPRCTPRRWSRPARAPRPRAARTRALRSPATPPTGPRHLAA